MSIVNKNNKPQDEKPVSSFSLIQNPENFLFFGGIVLFWLYWNYDVIFSWKHPTLIMLYWLIVIGLLIIIILSLYFYINYILADVFLKAENLSKTALVNKIKGFIKWSFVSWFLLTGHLGLKDAIIILYLFVIYYFLEKIYIRIIKKIDYKHETREQKYQIFRNNILLWFFFPLWYTVTIFTSSAVTHVLTVLYLTFIIIWHNRWPGFFPGEYIITKAPAGSAERFTLLKEALGAVDEDEPITNFEDESDISIEEETDDREDIGSEFEMRALEESKEKEYDLVKIKIEIEKKKNFQIYFKDKLYPIHEYYLWWLMKDVPFYFTIKAFFHMFIDILCWILRFILLIPLLVMSYFATATPASTPICHQLFWLFIILFFMVLVPTGWLTLYSLHVYYSWLAFFHREEAYAVLDDVHPYVVCGPTVDGPHTWQYWFYVFFSYFPSRALILQQQVYEEEIRLAEILVELDRDFMEFMDDDEDDTEYSPIKVDIWNPIDLIWLRNASPEEVQKYKDKLKAQERFKVEKEIVEDWKQTLNYETPRWWQHYYL